MADEYNYPPLNYFFEVKVGSFGGVDGYFSEVEGIEMQIETGNDIQEGGNNYEQYHLPGRATYTDLTLKRGMVLANSALYTWCENIINNAGDARIETKDVVVNLLSKPGTSSNGSVLMTWTFNKALPKKISFGSLSANDSAVMIETIVLVYRSFNIQRA